MTLALCVGLSAYLSAKLLCNTRCSKKYNNNMQTRRQFDRFHDSTVDRKLNYACVNGRSMSCSSLVAKADGGDSGTMVLKSLKLHGRRHTYNEPPLCVYISGSSVPYSDVSDLEPIWPSG